MATMETKRVTVSELQHFLRDRGVVVGQSKRQELLELVGIAKDLGLPVDPELCVEDRPEVIGEKLRDGNLVLSNPALLSGSSDISILPDFSFVNVCTYLMGHGVGITAIRDYRRSEAYSLMQDGFVSSVETMELTSGYYAVKASVKPRTRDRDPATNAPFYFAWAVLTAVGIDSRSCILSAFCTCKGGMDGCCRHVLAMLYEVLDYRQQDRLTSVTSGPCLWVRRSTSHNQAVLLSDVRTGDHIASQDAHEEIRPMPEVYTPIHNELPQVQTFFEGIRKLLPESCGLDAFEERQKLPPPPPPPLRVQTPSAKARDFFCTHICSSSACDCSEHFQIELLYSEKEKEHIEEDTRGQHLNQNWMDMRKGLVTASNVKKVLSSRDAHNTADRLLSPSTFNEGTSVPAPIQFGHKHESRALKLFTKMHRFRHRKCSVSVPGLCVSSTEAFLAASPDAIVNCHHCGNFVVEVKCLYSKQNMHPKAALQLCTFCELKDTFEMCKTHGYYAQLQCQMAVTGVQRGILLAYMKKGIHEIDVPFDEQWWGEALVHLRTFWKAALYPAFMATLSEASPAHEPEPAGVTPTDELEPAG